eukprot:11215587-Lingulodinium_polyedra.AAC.1
MLGMACLGPCPTSTTTRRRPAPPRPVLAASGTPWIRTSCQIASSNPGASPCSNHVELVLLLLVA